MSKKVRNAKGQSGQSELVKAIEKRLVTRGAELVQTAREMYSEYGRGYLNICEKGNDAFKAGQVHYINLEGNREIESRMEAFTENDVKLANYLVEYDPENEAVVVVWHGRLNYVNKITDTLAPMFATLRGGLIH